MSEFVTIMKLRRTIIHKFKMLTTDTAGYLVRSNSAPSRSKRIKRIFSLEGAAERSDKWKQGKEGDNGTIGRAYRQNQGTEHGVSEQ